MKQSRFTEAPIIGILKEQESGPTTAEASGLHGGREAMPGGQCGRINIRGRVRSQS